MEMHKLVIIAPQRSDSYTLDSMCWTLAERYHGCGVSWRYQDNYRKGWSGIFTDDIGTGTIDKQFRRSLQTRYQDTHRNIYGFVA